jgi:hypothetical protein
MSPKRLSLAAPTVPHSAPRKLMQSSADGGTFTLEEKKCEHAAVSPTLRFERTDGRHGLASGHGK